MPSCPGMRLRLALVSMLVSGCFEETTDGDGGDTDASVVPSCRECQMQECAEHESDCQEPKRLRQDHAKHAASLGA